MLAKIISNASRAVMCCVALCTLLFVTFLVAVPTVAQQAPVVHERKSTAAARESRRQMTSAAMQQALRDMFKVHAISEAVISPDGRRVAWVESLSGKNGALSPNSAIYVADWKSHSTPQRITAASGASAAESNVAWSSDSKQIAFLSDAAHSGQLQLYVVVPGGGARQLTHVRGDLSNPEWSPDGKSVAFLFIENAPRAAGPLAAEAPDEGVVGAKIYEQRLAIADLATGRVRQITPADMYVYGYDWSPGGKNIVATAAHGNGDDNWYVAQIYVFDAAARSAPQSIFKTDMQIGTPKWSPDGKSIAFIAGLMSDEPVVGGDIYTLPANLPHGGDAQDVTPGMKATASSINWSADSKSIVFGEIVDGQSGVASVDLGSGAITSLWSGAEHVGQNQF
ncbi:MAG: hypothetical protein ACRD33_07610, partial [Candidatus Acidiferrales bacterium]